MHSELASFALVLLLLLHFTLIIDIDVTVSAPIIQLIVQGRTNAVVHAKQLSFEFLGSIFSSKNITLKARLIHFNVSGYLIASARKIDVHAADHVTINSTASSLYFSSPRMQVGL